MRLIKEDGKYILSEMSIFKYIVVGGIVWSFLKWKNSSERLMKKNGLKYGDKVKKYATSSIGQEIEISGTIIQRNGIPKVKLDKSIGGRTIINWDTNFIKNK